METAVKRTVSCTDLSKFGEMNMADAKYFPSDPPLPRSTIRVAALPKGAKVETEAIASKTLLVYRLALMMTSLRSQWTAGKARGGRISKSIRNRRATQPPADLQRHPLGRGQFAVFPRCSLGPYQFRYGRFARVLKNSQLTCGDVTLIGETVHQRAKSEDGVTAPSQSWRFWKASEGSYLD